nr:glycosyltransferase [uncultured Cohaesibacter sp.]
MTIASICVASIGRDHLFVTIESVEKAIAHSGVEAEIIIADDSKTGAVGKLIGQRAGCSILQVAAGNVSKARNACLDAATGRWIIFVDDDEYVAEDWLSEFIAATKRHDAEVILAPVYHNYPESTPAWFRAADPLFDDWHWSDDGRLSEIGRTGNTLVCRAFIETNALRFDPAFGKTGGEDHDFFHRLRDLGGRMVVIDKAKAWEEVPLSRCNAAYMLKRSRIQGTSHARVMLARASFIKRFMFMVDAAAKLVASALLTLAALLSGRKHMLFWGMKAALNCGKILGALGVARRISWHPGQH